MRRALVGAHVLCAAPRLDTGTYRWVSTRAFGVGQSLAQWVVAPDGACLLQTGMKSPAIRHVDIGLDYNVEVRSIACSCGLSRQSVVAVRTVGPGEELVASAGPRDISPTGSLFMTTDGGGSRDAVGCAVVGFCVALGRCIHLDTIVIPMPLGETPQEAETHGFYSAILARPYFLRRAWERGLSPTEPDYAASDSRNTQ